MAEPVRTCVGCGRRASKQELVRFAAVEGRLAQGCALPGRGVYTCRRLACFEQAKGLGELARGLRRPVVVQPGLERLYTDAHG